MIVRIILQARALQYCLENEVNILGDNDWIVHLDEETLMTTRSVHGIMRFVADGRHQFGQGLITYANEQIVNWLTTLADSFRVAEDMGKLRFQFYMFHRPLFSWKGWFFHRKMNQSFNMFVLFRFICCHQVSSRKRR